MISQTNSMLPGSPLSAMMLAQLLHTTRAVSSWVDLPWSTRQQPTTSTGRFDWMYSASFLLASG